MKKPLIILTLLMCLLLFASCANTNRIPKGEYSLEVEGYEELLWEPLEKSYKPQETIIVKTSTVCDANVLVTLNGEEAINHELLHDEENEFYYYKWEFKMPSENSILLIDVP